MKLKMRKKNGPKNGYDYIARMPESMTTGGSEELLQDKSDSDEFEELDEDEKKARRVEKRAREKREFEKLLDEVIWLDGFKVDGYTLKKPRLDDSEEEEEEKEVRSLPDVVNGSPERDIQYVKNDGCFKVVGMGPVIQNNNLSGINAMTGCNKLWVKEDAVEHFSKEMKKKKMKETDVQEDRDFKALHEKSRGARYQITGVFGAGCGRHDTVFRLVDMDGGEKFKYPLAVISSLHEKETRKVPMSIMYDLGCKLKPSLEAFMPELKRDTPWIAVAVFHTFAHVIDCQMSYHPYLIEGFGRSNGEGMERFWSYLRAYITMTKEMSPENRHFVLYMAVISYNETIEFNLPGILKKRCQQLLSQQFALNVTSLFRQYLDDTFWEELSKVNITLCAGMPATSKNLYQAMMTEGSNNGKLNRKQLRVAVAKKKLSLLESNQTDSLQVLDIIDLLSKHCLSDPAILPNNTESELTTYRKFAKVLDEILDDTIPFVHVHGSQVPE